MTKPAKKTRRELHAAINALPHDDIAQIVKQFHPRTKGAARIDELAKQAISEAQAGLSAKIDA